jgi:hypothetical protein
MKTIIITIIAIMYSLTISAQYKHYNEETKQWKSYSSYEEYIFEESEFIFEGTVIKNEGYWSEKDKMIYTSNIVQIDKIFRGGNTIKLGTIEIVTRGGKVGDEWCEIPSSMPYQGGFKYIFFCVPSNYEFNPSVLTENTVHLTSLTVLGYDKTYNAATGALGYYKPWNEVYDFLGKQKNITIPTEEIVPIKKKDASGSLDAENKKKYAQSHSNYEKYMQYVQAKIATNTNNKSNACKEFFISEYADGPQKNKVIEIYNPSDSIKSLNGYSIKIFNNGAPTPLDIPLSGNVNPKETYVVTHPQADPQILAKAHQTDVKMNFDGNDAIVLNKGTSTYIDKIGEIGVNPGQAGWNVPPGASTKQQDLRRKQPIDKGETDWNQGKNQWDAFPQDSLGNVKQHQNICSSIQLVNDLSFFFANPTESGTSPKYFEFDVMVEANNNSTYLDNAILHIKYNSAVFGTNAVANNKVTVTKGTSFNTATYIDPNLYMNNGVDTIFIPFGSDPGQTSWNRTLITSSAIQLMHIKIEIQNCGQFSDLQFTNTSFTSFFSWYTTTATDDPINSVSYDNTNYLNNLNQELCPPPVINTFTSPVYPGTYYDGTTETKHILTIQGNGFGVPRGKVYFKNANDPEAFNTYRPLNANDFTLWSDTQIEIIMPSIIDSSGLSTPPTPGSGIFFLVTSSNDTVYSTTPIDMPYAIKNTKDTSATNGKLRLDLVNKIDSIGYEFYLGPSITNNPNPMVETIVRRAVKDWACNTLVNFVIKGDTAIDASLSDGVSVIHLVSSFPDTSTLAETTIWGGSCDDLASIKHTFAREIDIAFLADPATVGQGTWLYDTSSAVLPAGYRDFYEVAVHEVGHGDLLSHVNNVNDVMFYSGLYDINNDIVGGNRRWIAFNDVDGGQNVVERSKTIVYSGSCSFETSTYISGDFSCAGVISVKEHPLILADFNLFPNPSDNGFTVDYTLTRNASVQFVFLDYTGRELKHFDLKKESTGQHKLYIETNNLTAGLYFLVANIDGKLQTLKVIKQ